MSFAGVYAGKRVLVTGETGFKGAWLAYWLERLGARVAGLSLPPPTEPSLYALAKLGDLIAHREADVRDPSVLRDALDDRPDVVFHLAAQAIVRQAYADPTTTFASNVMGTVHLLDAVRLSRRPCAVVVVTTDKCYENEGSKEPHRETDRFGGRDPYSASKAAAEIVIASYRSSYFPRERLSEHGVALASARAGNVVGPGDWAHDRIVPDCVRALAADRPVPIRNPEYVRPWQHVLEPLSGYLWLGAALFGANAATVCEGWNFGPDSDACRSVRELVDAMIASWGGGRWEHVRGETPVHETESLRLSITKAASALRWRPVWSFDETTRRTATGYRRLSEIGANATHVRTLMSDEIDAYVRSAVELGVPWAS